VPKRSSSTPLCSAFVPTPWTVALVRETQHFMAALLPLRPHEREFLERLNGAGEIVPEVLTGDPSMQAIIREHPGLAWKALNVRKRLNGRPPDDGAGP